MHKGETQACLHHFHVTVARLVRSTERLGHAAHGYSSALYLPAPSIPYITESTFLHSCPIRRSRPYHRSSFHHTLNITMAGRQVSRADLQYCLNRMNDSQQRRFAATSSEHKRQILLAILDNAVSPVSTQSSPHSSVNDDDEDNEAAMLRTTSMRRIDTNQTDWSQHAVDEDDDDARLMTAVSPTSSNQPR